MIRILFLMPNLGGGGAEKVLVNLVNNMNKCKFDVTVKTIFEGGVNKDKLKSDIKYVCRKKQYFKGVSRFYSFLPMKLLYKNIVGRTRYDIVVAYMHGIPTKVIGGAPKGVKKVSWVHGEINTGHIFKCFRNKRSAIAELKRHDAIVGVSETVCESFTKHTGITEKMYVCYNTNETEEIILLAKENVDLSTIKKPIICSVGRFTPEKGFSRLIDISKRLNEEGFTHSLMLLGDGPLRKDLEQKVNEMGYGDVYFAGYQKNPYAYMSHADMFVCSSYYEGLSTATTEAVILGLPCVSTDVSGAREILTEDSQGIVVENNDDALYDGIQQMIEKINQGKIDYAKIRRSADKFTVQNTVKKVEELFESILNKKGE